MLHSEKEGTTLEKEEQMQFQLGFLAMSPHPPAVLGAEDAWLCSIDHHRSLAPIAFPNTQECNSPH